MKRCQRRARKGVAAVEFALVAPLLFFTIFFPMIEFARAMMVLHTLADASQIGCRQGALPGTSTSTITTTVNNTLSGQSITGATVTVSVNGSSGEDASAAVHNDVISVQASIPYSSVTWLPTGSLQYLGVSNLSVTKAMCRE